MRLGILRDMIGKEGQKPRAHENQEILTFLRVCRSIRDEEKLNIIATIFTKTVYEGDKMVRYAEMYYGHNGVDWILDMLVDRAWYIINRDSSVPLEDANQAKIMYDRAIRELSRSPHNHRGHDERARQLYEMGLITPNEVRRMLGQPPIEEIPKDITTAEFHEAREKMRGLFRDQFALPPEFLKKMIE